jgi:hypothetical protein
MSSNTAAQAEFEYIVVGSGAPQAGEIPGRWPLGAGLTKGELSIWR